MGGGTRLSIGVANKPMPARLADFFRKSAQLLEQAESFLLSLAPA
jgi:hypothetical protein